MYSKALDLSISLSQSFNEKARSNGGAVCAGRGERGGQSYDLTRVTGNRQEGETVDFVGTFSVGCNQRSDVDERFHRFGLGALAFTCISRLRAREQSFSFFPFEMSQHLYGHILNFLSVLKQLIFFLDFIYISHLVKIKKIDLNENDL
jgi:hypothetical protein